MNIHGGLKGERDNAKVGEKEKDKSAKFIEN